MDETEPQIQIALVVDTNIVISNLDIVEELHQLAAQYGHIIIFPWVVLQELDVLKSCDASIDRNPLHSMHSKGKRVGVKARKGINWIYERFAHMDPYVVGQKMTDTLTKTSQNDDAILDCCVYFREVHEAFTVLLSNDKNLCTKALIHGIRTVTYVESMTADSISQIVFKAAVEDARHQEVSNDLSLESMDIDEDYRGGTVVTSTADARSLPVISVTHSIDEPSTGLQQFSVHNRTPIESIDELEPPSVETLMPIIEDELLEHVKDVIDAQIKIEYDNDLKELEYFGYTRDSLDSFEKVRETLNRFSISVFSPLIPRALSASLKSCELWPVTKPEFLHFIDVWGSIWISLERKDREHIARRRVEEYKALLVQVADNVDRN